METLKYNLFTGPMQEISLRLPNSVPSELALFCKKRYTQYAIHNTQYEIGFVFST
jgi:hypothetical protein